MKRLCVQAILILLAISLGTAFADEGLTKIAENVYSYVGVKNGEPANSFAANAGIVVGKDGIVVVDTLISAKQAQRFLKDIRNISDKPIRYVIATHSHLDHIFGNAEFVKTGAVVVAHANCRTNMLNSSEETLENAGQHGLTPEQMEGTEIAYPTITFTDRMSINLGDETVDLIYIAPSHTSGSIMVHIPGEKVLFSGDILFTDFHPYLGEGDIPNWIRNLDYIDTLNVDRIIPGHGPISGKNDIADMKNYLVTFDTKARELAAQSDDVEFVTVELKKLLPIKSQADWMIPYNLGKKYMVGK